MTKFSRKKTDIGLRHDPGPQDLTSTPDRHPTRAQRLSRVTAHLSTKDRAFLFKMFNEIMKRDMQICTSDVSLDHSKPALGGNTAGESATHLSTGEPDESTPEMIRLQKSTNMIIAYHDLLRVRHQILQSTQDAKPFQDEDTLAVSIKTLQDAQNRFIQASQPFRTSRRRFKLIRAALLSESCAPDEEGHGARDTGERNSVDLSWVMPLSINIQIKR
ncbi:hypothetical protein N7540_004619 [Penicillium herquei]|nr:hypothetical protein N7540_004619 [Penicillium herquei]